MEKIPVVIIGLGRIASLLEDDALREKPCTHAGAVAANPDLRLAAGCDIDEERRRLFAEKWRVPVYADAAEMIRVHAPRLLVVATRPDSHRRCCELAAARGIPVVICEKPLADKLGDARRIARLAADGFPAGAGAFPARAGRFPAGAGRVKIITNHERRYAEDYIRAAAILGGGRLGRLLSVRAVLYMGRNRRLLDVFWHDGTHLADALMFLSGLTLKHRRRWGAKLTEKTGTAWLEALLVPSVGHGRPVEGIGQPPAPAAAPVPVLIEVGAGRDHLVFEMEFSCERGRLRIGNGVFEVAESVPSPYAEKFRSLEKTGETFEGPTGYFANMVKDAAACVLEPDRQPRSSAADGLRVIEYLHSVKAWGR
ncbi:MAG: Gfo/Idh/MocA family oxidoreductase [Treponema sp.]|jgi:predicted dehydrogenase|nr:Gfo/Idh/MocA family oxidoreductase [Treponema sp.]